jgi:hypothetical protein
MQGVAAKARSLRRDDGDEELPDSAATMDSKFVNMTLMYLAPVLVLSVLAAFGVRVIPARLLGVLSVVFPSMFVASVGGSCVVQYAYFKMPIARTWELGWRAPKWWRTWWPKRFRRPGDVWHRLPRDARVYRLVLPLFLAALSGITLGAFWLAAIGPRIVDTGFATLSAGTAIASGATIAATLIGVGVWAAALASRFRRQFGVSAREFGVVQRIPVADARWRQEQFARFLAPVAGAGSVALEVTGRRDAIEEAIRQLKLAKIDVPADLVDAVSAAHLAVADITREIEQLRADVDPEELARLDRRLASLRDSDSDLRKLLEGQRELLVRLDGRASELVARKLRIEEQLRFLHQQLLELRSRNIESHGEITGRIRHASDELRRIGEGWNEANALTAPM